MLVVVQEDNIMPIQYPTTIEISGPWLLDDESLLQLDAIVDEEFQRLESRRKALIEEEARKKVQERIESGFIKKGTEKEKEYLEIYINDPSYSLALSNRQVSLLLKNKVTYTTDKFTSALRDNALLDEIVTGFSVDIESSDIRCKVYTKNWSNELAVNVSPETNNEAREIFVSLRNWAEKNTSSYWKQLWGKIDFPLFFVWLMVIFIGFMLWSMSISSTAVTSDAKLRAHDLLDSGITQQNSLEAIELLLIIQTGYDPSARAVVREIPTWLMIVFWSGLILNILLSFKPKTPILGIGKGRSLILKWRFWQRLVGVTIPGLIFSSFLWPIFVEWFSKLIK